MEIGAAFVPDASPLTGRATTAIRTICAISASTFSSAAARFLRDATRQACDLQDHAVLEHLQMVGAQASNPSW